MTQNRHKIKVLTVGPDIRDLGGISAILRTYRSVVPGFVFSPTNSRRGTVMGVFVLAGTLAKLPYYRLRGHNVLHAHGASGKSFTRKRLLMNVARLLGYKTIFHCHGGGFREFAAQAGAEHIARQLGKFDAIVGLTPEWKDFFSSSLNHQRVVVVANVVEAPSEPIVREPRNPGEPLKAVFLGKICDQKGVFDLLEAINLRRNDLAGKLKVRIGGNGESDRLKETIERLELGQIVEYIGGVYGQEKDALLRESELMLLPSYTEGMPITLLEAGVYSMTSLATPVGGVPSLIKPGVNGTLVSPGDLEAIGQVLVEYADSPERVREEGLNALRMVEPHLPSSVNQTLNNLYTSLFENR